MDGLHRWQVESSEGVGRLVAGELDDVQPGDGRDLGDLSRVGVDEETDHLHIAHPSWSRVLDNLDKQLKRSDGLPTSFSILLNYQQSRFIPSTRNSVSANVFQIAQPIPKTAVGNL